MLPTSIDLLLDSDPEAPSVARRSLAEVKGLLDARRFEDVRLLVTELVTNSVLHAPQAPGGEIRLWVSASAGRLRIEVSDHGLGFEKPSFEGPPDDARGGGLFSSGTGQDGGRGLYLVERLSDHWGVILGDSTCVWFELDLERNGG